MTLKIITLNERSLFFLEIHIICLHLYNTLQNANECIAKKQVSGCLGMGEGQEGGIWFLYGYQKTFGDDEQVHYLDLGDNFKSVYICQNVSNYVP